MDRRRFFKTIFIVPSLTPFLLAKGSPKGGFELYLISDSPHLVISPILRELQKFGLAQGHKYNCPDSHPSAEGLRNAIDQTGWRYASMPSGADLNLTFSYLHDKALPSFTFIKDGRIWDIRSRELLSIWTEMNKNGRASSLLTIVSFKKKQTPLLQGGFADILINGRRAERISLRKEYSKLFRTQRGNIAVMVKEGKAWVSDSSCRNKICVCSSPVSMSGNRIICAPNHFLLEVIGSHTIDTSIG